MIIMISFGYIFNDFNDYDLILPTKLLLLFIPHIKHTITKWIIGSQYLLEINIFWNINSVAVQLGEIKSKVKM